MMAFRRYAVFLIAATAMLAGCSSTSEVAAPQPSPTESISVRTTYVLPKDLCNKVPFDSWEDLLGKPSFGFRDWSGKDAGRVADCRIIVGKLQTFLVVKVTLLRPDSEPTATVSPVAGNTIVREPSVLAGVAAKARLQAMNKQCGISLVDGNMSLEIYVERLKGAAPEAQICDRMPAFLLSVLQLLPTKE